MARGSDTTAPYLAQYASAKPTLPGRDIPWLGALREEAIARFADVGFPTPKVEAWKYTNLTRLARAGFGDVDGVAGIGLERLAPWLFDRGETHRFVLVNGRFAPELSELEMLPDGVTLTSLAALADSQPGSLESTLGRTAALNGAALVALNTALMRDGAVLVVDRNTILDKPVHLINFVATENEPIAVHPRNLVVVGERSQATIVESYAGDQPGRYWTNAVTEIVAHAGSVIHHVKLQEEAESAYHTGSVQIELGRDSTVNGFTASLGATMARSDIKAAVLGEGASCRLDGGVLVRGSQHGDITTEIDHRVPHGASRQMFKNVLDDRGRSVFQGRIIVQPDAQKVDAHQSNRNLLLSPRAQAETKPELQILADDVKCSHGATVGDLDRNALFYLESRGIDAARARALLIEAFLGELIETAPGEGVQRRLRALVGAWLGVEPMLEQAA